MVEPINRFSTPENTELLNKQHDEHIDEKQILGSDEIRTRVVTIIKRANYYKRLLESRCEPIFFSTTPDKFISEKIDE